MRDAERESAIHARQGRRKGIEQDEDGKQAITYARKGSACREVGFFYCGILKKFDKKTDVEYN